ncbi:hypothetical protein [Roseibium sp.]|uniref:hypothetical protein n=1 Tax=Roseibium sp. TaxID=1936156 RepID=UPI003296A236
MTYEVMDLHGRVPLFAASTGIEIVELARSTARSLDHAIIVRLSDRWGTLAFVRTIYAELINWDTRRSALPRPTMAGAGRPCSHGADR